MKKLFLILTLVVMTFTLKAQPRIHQMLEINQRTYEEAIELLMVMDRTMRIEMIEGIRLKNEILTTQYGEITLRKVGHNSIRIELTEITNILNDHISYPSRRIYEIQSIQTETILQTADLYEYMSKRLARNHMVKSVQIKIDQRTGGAYVSVNLHKF